MGVLIAGEIRMAVKKAHDADFSEILRQDKKPILVDFWAEWCGPCRMIAPAIEELSQQFNAEMDFFKLNVDENPKTAEKFGIMSIPSLMIFNHEVLVHGKLELPRKIKLPSGSKAPEFLKRKLRSQPREKLLALQFLTTSSN
jgi:thioredoxin 1